MKERILRWIKYNLIFALLPLGVSIFFRTLLNKLSLESLSNSPELLFFSIMVSATALDDISELKKINTRLDFTIKLFGSALLFGAIWSAILYGTFLYDSLAIKTELSIRNSLFKISIYMGIALFILSTSVQIILGKIEGQKNG